MEMQVTDRGFQYITFTDRYGSKCILQKSSLATESAIWFGPRKLVLKKRVEVPLEEGVIGNERMHLTQEQVKTLLPMLQRFAETGEL